ATGDRKRHRSAADGPEPQPEPRDDPRGPRVLGPALGRGGHAARGAADGDPAHHPRAVRDDAADERVARRAIARGRRRGDVGTSNASAGASQRGVSATLAKTGGTDYSF